ISASRGDHRRRFWRTLRGARGSWCSVRVTLIVVDRGTVFGLIQPVVEVCLIGFTSLSSELSLLKTNDSVYLCSATLDKQETPTWRVLLRLKTQRWRRDEYL